MGYPILRTSPKPWASQQLWAFAEQQHGVVARRQLLDLGLSAKSIKHRIAAGCLHPIWRGVYAIGRPQLTLRGRWMAAVLSCGRDAVLSHGSAAAHWEILPARSKEVEVTVPVERRISRPGQVRARTRARHPGRSRASPSSRARPAPRRLKIQTPGFVVIKKIAATTSKPAMPPTMPSRRARRMYSSESVTSPSPEAAISPSAIA
jgi:hypothetical protein